MGGLLDSIGGLLGFDTQTDYNARQAQSANNTAQGSLYSNAQANVAQGQNLTNQAAGGYSTIARQGLGQASSAYDQLQAANAGYANAGGANYTAAPNPYTTAGGNVARQSTNPNGTGYIPTLATPTAANPAPNGRVPNGYTPNGTTQPATNGGNITSPTGQAVPSAATAQNPYQLTQAQQEQLNQTVDKTNAERQTAIANYKASAAASGQQPLPAQIEYINNYYDQQNNTQTANFAEQARAQREAAYNQLVQNASGLLSAGVAQQETGTAGVGNLGENALGLGASGLSQYAGNALNQYNNAQQAQNQQNAGYGELLGLGLSFLPGAFGGGGTGGFSDPASFGVPLP